MAVDYAKVLIDLGEDFVVIGRSEDSAKVFEEATGVSVKTGGLARALGANSTPKTAILAVGIEQLAATAELLIRAGTKRILMEKPGGVNIAELTFLEDLRRSSGSEISIGYNRRFYTSTLRSEELIAEDGGVTSFDFEFTEWAHQIQHLRKPSRVMEHWALGNSSHVMDLAFFLGGFPKEWNSWSAGALGWHPAASRFCGAGISERGALFSYHADWEAPGRWGIDVLTRKRRIIFRPMEKLLMIPLGSVDAKPVDLADRSDRDFKPGLYRQTKAFLAQDLARFCSLTDQVRHVQIYTQIAGYL